MALFHYLSLRAFAHETEDLERVTLALRHVAQVPDVAVATSKVDGSHGNRIWILESTVKSASAERALFDALARDDPRGFAQLEREVDRRVDEHLNLFLRLDKQQAYAGRMVLAADDDAVTVRGKLRTFPKGAEPLQRARDEVRAFLVKAGSPKR